MSSEDENTVFASLEVDETGDDAVQRGGRVTAEPTTLVIDACGFPITIHQDPFHGCGGNLWHAAMYMCHYFQNKERFPDGFFVGKRVIELGSGTGLVGICLRKLGAACVLTDLKLVLPLISKNVDENLGVGTAASGAVAELAWGEDVSAFAPPVDVVIASDCTYNEHCFDLLLQTIGALSSPSTHIILSFQKRRKADNVFFTKARKHFRVVEMPREAVPGVGPRSEEFRKTRIVELHKLH
jgi:predicted nicotinamide N-methyase